MMQTRENSAESSLVSLQGNLFGRGEVRMACYVGWQLFRRDIKARYRKTALGYVWAVLPALGTTLTFVFLNSARLLNAGDTGVPYPVFAFMGALFWRFIMTAITAPMDVVQSNVGVMTKVYFPRMAPLIAASLLILFDFLINLTLAPVVMVAFGVAPSATILLLPVLVLLMMVFGFSVGILLSPIGLLYHDTKMAVTLLFSFLVLASPIGYTPAAGSWLHEMMSYNPIAWLIDAARASMIGMPVEHGFKLLMLGVGSLVVMLMAITAFLVVLPIAIERQSS